MDVETAINASIDLVLTLQLLSIYSCSYCCYCCWCCCCCCRLLL